MIRRFAANTSSSFTAITYFTTHIIGTLQLLHPMPMKPVTRSICSIWLVNDSPVHSSVNNPTTMKNIAKRPLYLLLLVMRLAKSVVTGAKQQQHTRRFAACSFYVHLRLFGPTYERLFLVEFLLRLCSVLFLQLC